VRSPRTTSEVLHALGFSVLDYNNAALSGSIPSGGALLHITEWLAARIYRVDDLEDEDGPIVWRDLDEGERIERPADGRCARRLLIGSDEQRSDAIGSDAIGSDAIGSDAIGSDAIGRGATTAAAASPLAASTVQLQPIVLSGLGFPESGGAYSAYTAAFLAGSLLIALAVDDLGVVMAVVGATGSTAVSYILPGAIYWVLHPHPHAMRFAAGAMFAAGVCITPVSLAAILTSHGDS